MIVVITGDASRPIPAQETNIDWIHGLLNYQVATVTASDVKKISIAPIDTLEQWLDTYNADKPDCYGRLFSDEAFSRNDIAIVIGFEMPSNLLKKMDSRNMYWIDLIAHPIRFMDDIVLGFRFCKRFNVDNLENYRITDMTFRLHAELVMAKLKRLPKIPMNDNACLLVGQTHVDRSVLVNGRIVTLDEYKSQIEGLKNTHGELMFKNHPAQSTYDRVRDVCSRLTNENVYYLMAQDKLKTVCGISSSVLYESEFFCKKAVFFGEKKVGREYMPVTPKDMLSFRFWTDVFRSAGLPAKEVKEPWIIETPNRLRKSCMSWWGYDFIDQGGSSV